MNKICGSCKKRLKQALSHVSIVNNVINACRSCIAMANANSQKRDSINEKENNEHSTDTNSSIEPTESNSRTHVPNSSSDPLQQILKKLTKLKSLDNRLTEI